MSLLDGIFGITSIFKNGVELFTRKGFDFIGEGWTIEDNPTTGLTEIHLPDVGESTGELPSLAANTMLGNASTSSATAEETAPNAFIFKSTTSGAGNIRAKVAPQGYGAITSLATAGNVNVDIDPGENGTYQFSVFVRVKMASAGTRLTKAAMVCANRVSGTLTLEGTALPIDVGLGTGLTLTISATGGSLRVNIANATGETISGRVHVGWFVEDLL